MKLTIDNKQRLMTGFLVFIELYKMLMGSFLVIFVPQKCNGLTCTASQTLFRGGLLNMTGTVCNFVTFTSIGTLYFIELKRESWSIKYLDIDHNKPINNLDHEIECYPKIKREQRSLNKKYLNALHGAILMVFINFIISGLIVILNSEGINTYTSFGSFFLLVSLKLASAFKIGLNSVQKERNLSAYMKEPITYNIIDLDYKKETNHYIYPDERGLRKRNINLNMHKMPVVGAAPLP
tara:strand:+ start:529 stop:1239 length:711 start_codon:yes stop_codon:yes gene_type:complete